MKVAIYCRISRIDLNNDNQKIALEKHAKEKGWEYEVFEETESTRNTRPIKEKVLQLLREGKFDGVLVYKIDRWARSLQELIMNIDELKNRNKHFIVLTQPIDTSNASGMLMLQILGAFAEFERDIIRERTMAGLARAKAQGKKLGRPWGKGMPEAKEDDVARLLAQAKTEREIAKELGTSRYKVQKAIISISRKNVPSKTGGDNLISTSG